VQLLVWQLVLLLLLAWRLVALLVQLLGKLL
jgi:hypothetical protein